ncbi:MAG: hypothetical protein GXP31_07780 [Kiritimatiellaeota bacterium]|nr:hypothetical protein [Kiritimatiellota bacterium]
MNSKIPCTPRLVLDDDHLEDSAFVTRTWHQPQRFDEPVLRPEHPWERWCPVLFGTVLRREDRWQMWYCAWTRRCPPRVCYAESRDGVAWEKPELGLLPFQGNTHTNIILQSRSETGLIDDLTVIEDARDRNWPLKMLFFDTGGAGVERGIYAARSADGIRWELMSEQPVLRWGDRFNAVPQRLDGRFVVFGRTRNMPDMGKGRCVFRTESETLLEWSPPELVLARDAEDPPDMEIYSVTAFPWHGMLLGAIERMHMAPDRLDPELVWSRDAGRNWRRSRTRPAFIPLAPSPSWQDTWINLSASPPISADGQLRFYYSGRGGAHMSPYPLNQGAIGLAVLRPDGFCSMRAGQRPGWIVTRPETWHGGDLAVNADPRLDDRSHPAYCHGEMRVEVRTPDGSVVPGYSMSDCNPLRSNTIQEPNCSRTVRWGERSADALAGREITFRFELREAHLYSWHARP